MNNASESASSRGHFTKTRISAIAMSVFLALALCLFSIPTQAFAASSRESVASAKKYSLSALTATATSPTQVRLSWVSAGNVVSYTVFRVDGSGSSWRLISTTKSTSYTDSSVKPGTIYTYMIEAELSNSQIVTSSIEEAATPPKSTTVTVSPNFPKGVTVKWSAAQGANRYYLLRAVKGSNKFSVIQTTSSTSYKDNSAVGKKYVYKVRPAFVSGYREYSRAADSPQASSDSGKWKKKGTSKAFVFSNGKTAKGWQLIAGKWYCFSNSGKMLKNTFKVSGSKRTYLGSKGTIKTGWITVKGKKYYGLKTGYVAKGWQTISGKRYYFKKNGVMAKNTYVNGYHLGKNGAWDNKIKSGSSVGTISVTKSLLTKVNQARKKVGASTLKWDSGLADTAKKRAVEIKRLFSHTRPNGTSCFTAFPSYLKAAGENIAMGQRSVAEVNKAWTNSPGHYSNMVNTMFNCFGAACFTVNGTKYWVELFGYK